MIILVLSKKNEIYETKKKKNTLISVSNVNANKLEIARLILYLFGHYCSKDSHEPSLEEYLSISDRLLKNVQSVRNALRILSELRISYYNNNFKKEEQQIFKRLYLMGGKIYYSINSFFISKLSFHGDGHKDVQLAPLLFRNTDYRSHKKNSIRLTILVNLLTYGKNELSDLEKHKIAEVLCYYFENDDYAIMINKVCKQYIQYRKTNQLK